LNSSVAGAVVVVDDCGRPAPEAWFLSEELAACVPRQWRLPAFVSFFLCVRIVRARVCLSSFFASFSSKPARGVDFGAAARAVVGCVVVGRVGAFGPRGPKGPAPPTRSAASSRENLGIESNSDHHQTYCLTPFPLSPKEWAKGEEGDCHRWCTHQYHQWRLQRVSDSCWHKAYEAGRSPCQSNEISLAPRWTGTS